MMSPCLGSGLNTELIQGHLDIAGVLKGQFLCLLGKTELPAVQVTGMVKTDSLKFKYHILKM